MKTISLSVLVLLLLACNGHTRQSKIENTNQETMGVQEEIGGKWELYRVVCCGRAAQEKLVGENDRKEYLKFYPDKNLVKTFDMGFLLDKSNYKFTNLIDQPESLQEFIQIGEKYPAIILIKNDTLMLSWEYMDLERKYYKRVK